MKIFVAGIWGRVGGASGECRHAVLLWKRFGADVTMIPTWGKPAQDVLDDCARIGVRVQWPKQHHLASVEGLRGATVVSFGNDHFLRPMEQFRKIGCRVVYAPLMTYLREAERRVFRNRMAFDTLVYQSEYQRAELQPAFEGLGQPAGTDRLIRGAMAWWLPEWQFNPREHAAGEPFVVGRFARHAKTKWHRDYWEILGRIPNVRATLLGVDEALKRYFGPQPAWATCIPPGGADAAALYRTLHAVVSCNGTDKENYPRIGLEAMASGVPVVAEDQWGWREQVVSGQTGFLYRDPAECSEMATRLASDEDLRIGLAIAARKRLESELANPEVLWSQWEAVLR